MYRGSHVFWVSTVEMAKAPRLLNGYVVYHRKVFVAKMENQTQLRSEIVRCHFHVHSSDYRQRHPVVIFEVALSSPCPLQNFVEQLLTSCEKFTFQYLRTCDAAA